ncbi:MAG: permease [Eubacteriales bacterium]
MNAILDFIQNQILSMRWLNTLIGRALEGMNLDLANRWVGSLQFFLFDTIKIFILLCTLIFVISYIQSFFPPERAKRTLSRFRGVWANTAAALLGTVTPFCSCSSIPLFIGFTGAGLPIGVTFSFLISSPMVDLGSLVVISSIFGAKIAGLYVLCGLVIAVLGGLLIEKLHMERYLEDVVVKTKLADVAEQKLTVRERVSYAASAMAETFKKVFPYVLAGVAIGAVIHNWIPEEWVVAVLGSKNPFGVVLATLTGVPMYADIFGTIPVAEALFAKGARLGSVIAFMMAVTTLSLPSLMMLRRAVKPKLLALFTLICTIGIIAIGYLFNVLQGAL